MVTEIELNTFLKQARIQALRDALSASPANNDDLSIHHVAGIVLKEKAIEKLLDAEGTKQLSIGVVPKFNIRNLAVLAYANGFTLWHYKEGAPAVIASPSFFSEAADMFVVGDIIMCSSKDGMQIVHVNSVENKTVQISF